MLVRIKKNMRITLDIEAVRRTSLVLYPKRLARSSTPCVAVAATRNRVMELTCFTYYMQFLIPRTLEYTKSLMKQYSTEMVTSECHIHFVQYVQIVSIETNNG